ncbi:hypothetical protein VE04_04400 [Pseudogymnoascus sp. 24MN13]|nr:hypothetical protein VE04_04400 [Pseudogymnoascus sp. 24MN13]
MPRNANTLCIEACRADDVSLMEQALAMAAEPNSRFTAQQVAQLGLSRSASRRAVHVLKYLVDHLHDADIAAVTPGQITTNEDMGKPSLEVLEILVAHGWDINTPGVGSTLLWDVVTYHDLVKWCLDHGAKVDIPDYQPEVIGNVTRRNHMPRPTILGAAASQGSIETLDLLAEHMAPLDPRTLHLAVERATILAPREGEEPSPSYTERLDMIRHLIDVAGLDVNAKEPKVGSTCNTPLCIAVGRLNHQNFQELVDVLMDRGADPNLNCKTQEDAPGWPSAMVCAETHGTKKFLQAAMDRQAEKQGEKRGDTD